MNVSRFTFNMFGVNTYILWDAESQDAIIVDPGMSTDAERGAIEQFISKNDLRLTHLVNTHMHIDHSFGISYITDKYDLPLECNMSDQFLAERIIEQAKMFGLPVIIGDLSIKKNLGDGDKLYVGNEPLEILLVPGHSPGSIVLYAPDSSFLISGDVLFKASIGRTDLPGGNYMQLITAIHEKLLSKPDDTIVYPGHGPETTIRDEKIMNPYL